MQCEPFVYTYWFCVRILAQLSIGASVAESKWSPIRVRACFSHLAPDQASEDSLRLAILARALSLSLFHASSPFSPLQPRLPGPPSAAHVDRNSLFVRCSQDLKIGSNEQKLFPSIVYTFAPQFSPSEMKRSLRWWC